ncbi:MAG: PaaI family thioesterase [Acidimicrobiia bacterium]|nr:PaaI family thioesterase [Acidimicrobiia bacterium]
MTEFPEFRYLTGKVIPLPDPDAEIPPHHLPWCYGCGPENDHSLGVRFHLDGDRIVSELEFAPWFQGGPGVVHGGATAAFFDDLMGSVLMAHLKPSVTAKLEINYVRPLPLGITIRGEAWLAEEEGRKLWVEAYGADRTGTMYVEARALFLPISPDHWQEAVSRLDEHQIERLARYREGEYYP